MPPALYTVIFDASCGFCQQQVRWLRSLDWRKCLRFVPNDDPAVVKLAPAVTAADLAAAIQLVLPTGEVRSGAHAFRTIALRVPLLVPLALLLWVPGMLWVGERVYGLIARNRYVLSRWLGCQTACKR